MKARAVDFSEAQKINSQINVNTSPKGDKEKDNNVNQAISESNKVDKGFDIKLLEAQLANQTTRVVACQKLFLHNVIHKDLRLNLNVVSMLSNLLKNENLESKIITNIADIVIATKEKDILLFQDEFLIPFTQHLQQATITRYPVIEACNHLIKNNINFPVDAIQNLEKAIDLKFKPIINACNITAHVATQNRTCLSYKTLNIISLQLGNHDLLARIHTSSNPEIRVHFSNIVRNFCNTIMDFLTYSTKDQKARFDISSFIKNSGTLSLYLGNDQIGSNVKSYIDEIYKHLLYKSHNYKEISEGIENLIDVKVHNRIISLIAELSKQIPFHSSLVQRIKQFCTNDKANAKQQAVCIKSLEEQSQRFGVDVLSGDIQNLLLNPNIEISSSILKLFHTYQLQSKNINLQGVGIFEKFYCSNLINNVDSNRNISHKILLHIINDISLDFANQLLEISCGKIRNIDHVKRELEIVDKLSNKYPHLFKDDEVKNLLHILNNEYSLSHKLQALSCLSKLDHIYVSNSDILNKILESINTIVPECTNNADLMDAIRAYIPMLKKGDVKISDNVHEYILSFLQKNEYILKYVESIIDNKHTLPDKSIELHDALPI